MLERACHTVGYEGLIPPQFSGEWTNQGVVCPRVSPCPEPSLPMTDECAITFPNTHPVNNVSLICVVQDRTVEYEGFIKSQLASRN